MGARSSNEEVCRALKKLRDLSASEGRIRMFTLLSRR